MSGSILVDGGAYSRIATVTLLGAAATGNILAAASVMAASGAVWVPAAAVRHLQEPGFQALQGFLDRPIDGEWPYL